MVSINSNSYKHESTKSLNLIQMFINTIQAAYNNYPDKSHEYIAEKLGISMSSLSRFVKHYSIIRTKI